MPLSYSEVMEVEYHDNAADNINVEILVDEILLLYFVPKCENGDPIFFTVKNF